MGRTIQQKAPALCAGCLFGIGPILLLYAALILALQVFFWLRIGEWYSAPLHEVFFPPVTGLTLSAAPLNPLPHFSLTGTAFENWLIAPTQWVGVSRIVDWLLANSSVHEALFVLAILAVAIGINLDNRLRDIRLLES